MTESRRIISLDQFRGFAIFGMILVNYLGQFDLMPHTFKHPRFGMTFANAIAPYFLFAVGMGLRISLRRRIRNEGRRAALWHAVKRYTILILIGIVLYGPDPVCNMWDALVDIGFAGLITLPVILRSQAFRLVTALTFLCVYQLLFAYTGYGVWTMAYSIDGGPLGPLSWAAILLFGTMQMDWLRADDAPAFVRKSLSFGAGLLLVGYLLSLLEPASLWHMSQRSMTMSYPIFASGLSILTHLLFYVLGDLRGIVLPHLSVLGVNALAIYILQQVLIQFYGDYLPDQAPIWQALAGFTIIYAICYLVARYLWRQRIFIKL